MAYFTREILEKLFEAKIPGARPNGGTCRWGFFFVDADARNEQLQELANRFGVADYDGMDVGAVEV
jgi:hypothetical protein